MLFQLAVLKWAGNMCRVSPRAGEHVDSVPVRSQRVSRIGDRVRAHIMKARFVGFLSKFVTNLMRSVLVGGFRTTDGVGVRFCEKAIQNVKF